MFCSQVGSTSVREGSHAAVPNGGGPQKGEAADTMSDLQVAAGETYTDLCRFAQVDNFPETSGLQDAQTCRMGCDEV